MHDDGPLTWEKFTKLLDNQQNVDLRTQSSRRKAGEVAVRLAETQRARGNDSCAHLWGPL